MTATFLGTKLKLSKEAGLKRPAFFVDILSKNSYCTSMRVFLDMDGVVANFTKAACKVLDEPYPADQHLNDYGWLFEKHGDARCYSKIKGHLLWTSIEKFPWSDDLVHLVDKVSDGNWIFLTKPMIDPWCYSGKAEWIMKNYRSYLKKLTIIGEDKSMFVRNKDDILIDDHPKNIKNWLDAGGSTFHWTEYGAQYNPEEVQKRLYDLEQFLLLRKL